MFTIDTFNLGSPLGEKSGLDLSAVGAVLSNRKLLYKQLLFRPDDGNDLAHLDLGQQLVPKFFGFAHRCFCLSALANPRRLDRIRWLRAANCYSSIFRNSPMAPSQVGICSIPVRVSSRRQTMAVLYRSLSAWADTSCEEFSSATHTSLGEFDARSRMSSLRTNT
jgi:hypothetical protein